MLSRRLFCCLGLLSAFAVIPALLRADEPKTVRSVTTISLMGESDHPFADYMLLEGATLYVGFTSIDTLTIVDTDLNTFLASIPNLPRVHGVAIVPGLGGFTSNGGDDTVGVIDLGGRQLVRKILGGVGPDAIIYDAKAGLLYVADHRGKTATLIDPKTEKTVATIPLGGAAEFPQADPQTGVVYQNLEDTNEVVVVDPKKQAVVQRFKTAPGEGPTGLALDAAHHRLFCACGNQKLVILDTHDGHVVATLPIGAGVDGAAYDSKLRRIYTANGDSGTMTVIHQDTPDKYTVLEDVPTKPGGHTLVVDPATHRIYVVAGGDVLVFDAVIPGKSAPTP